MYIVHNINNIDSNSFFFGKNINNTVIANGRFTRVVYSTPMYTLNSILLNIKLNGINRGFSFIKRYIVYPNRSLHLIIHFDPKQLFKFDITPIWIQIGGSMCLIYCEFGFLQGGVWAR